MCMNRDQIVSVSQCKEVSLCFSLLKWLWCGGEREWVTQFSLFARLMSKKSKLNTKNKVRSRERKKEIEKDYSSFIT